MPHSLTQACLSSLWLLPSLGLLSLLLSSLQANSQNPNQQAIRIVPTSETPDSPDWLIDPSAYQATITEQKNGTELILGNGLFERRLRIQDHSIATVGLANLMTGQEILRSIKPEAVVEFNGQSYPIGGLEGLASANFFTTGELDQLSAAPGSYQFSSWEELPMEERFPWQPQPQWSGESMPWPPPGRHLVLHFTPPSQPPGQLEGRLLLREDFTAELNPDWHIHLSESHPDSSFSHEGKSAEIFALPDSAVYAELPWPEGAASIELELDCGTDQQANSWGPGLALVAGEETLSLVARPASQQFELGGSSQPELVAGAFERGSPLRLRATLRKQQVIFDARQPGGNWQLIGQAALAAPPTSLRIGKVGKNGSGQDNSSTPGKAQRTHLHTLSIRAAEPEAILAPRRDLPSLEVHYEIYDGLPAFSKWLVLHNDSGSAIELNSFSSELLAVVETAPKIEVGWNRQTMALGVAPADALVLDRSPLIKNQPDAPRDYLDRFMDLFVVTDYAMGGEMEAMKDNPAVHWKHDPDYEATGIRYYGLYQPALLECSPPIGPDLIIAPAEDWSSMRSFILLRDSSERERRGLAERRFWRAMAPWTQESPLFMHATYGDPQRIRTAIDQCAEVGFEMLVLSFGSGFNPTDVSPAHLENMRNLADYAQEKGIAIGGYSLLASRGGAPESLTIARESGEPSRYRYEGSHFGPSPCLATDWGVDYFSKLRTFYSETGMSVLEHDGSYPGDTCASESHSGHRGFLDSQWRQWEQIRDFYRWCRGKGVHLNVPDWHFLNGANTEPMGYVETNWSLPRSQQQIITRQNIFDGTFGKTASMGFMFVPLTQYHGGGEAATVEPLNEHLDHYETQIASIFGSGSSASFRGPRLYDSDETREMVRSWVDFYRKHRAVLGGDMIHLRRADGRDWDGWITVNPRSEEKAIAFLFNPLDTPITRAIQIPLYYSGLETQATLTTPGTDPIPVSLNSDQSLTVEVTIPARGRTYLLFQ